MKKIRLLSVFALIIISVLTFFVGCQNDDYVSSVSVKDYDPETVIETSVGFFDYSAYTLVVNYESGSSREVTLSEDMILEADIVKLYQEGEHEIAFSYEGCTCSVKIRVKRPGLSDISFPENNVFVYDGNEHTVEVEGELPANAVVTYPGGNSFVNAGTYDVTAIVSCDGYVSIKLSTTVKIERAKYDMSGVKFEAKEFVYDGKEHKVEVAGEVPDGLSAPRYTINGKNTSSAIEAGVYNVIASFTNSNPNYENPADMETTLTINQAEYTVDGVEIVFRTEDGRLIEDASKVYDGLSVQFDIEDYNKIPSKVSVSFSVTDEAGKLVSQSNKNTSIVNAGIYTVTANFSLADSKNYKQIEPVVSTFEVKRTDYILSGITLGSASTVYDGKEHSIAIEGVLPADVTVAYEYYLAEKLVTDEEGNPVKSVSNAGRYTVKAIFTHTDNNRKEISPLSAVLQITQAEIDVSSLFFKLNGGNIYDGEPKWLSVDGEIPKGLEVQFLYSVNGVLLKDGENYATSVVNSGVYNVFITFIGSNPNYLSVGMMNYELVIEKATIDVSGVVVDGLKEYTYDGNSRVPALDEKTLTEKIKESVNITQTLYSVDEDGYRSDATFIVDSGSYAVIYTIALKDSNNYHLVGNTSVEWYFTINPQIIEVEGVTFIGEKFTYNGNAQAPVLSPLPEHVVHKVEIYDIGRGVYVDEAVNAGSYRYVVTLSGESNNYYCISKEPFYEQEFEILPMEIDVSGLEFDSTTFTYNGKQQYPSLKNVPAHVTVSAYLHWDDNVYNNSEIWDGKWLAIDVGVYGCRITLRSENSNYKLVGPTIYTTSFKISRIPIDISDKFTEDFKLIYTTEGYNIDILKKLVLDGISEHVECLPSSYRLEIGENQWQYTPTMISTGRYKIEIMFRVKDSTNYSLLYNGVAYQQIIIDVYFDVDLIDMIGESSYTYDAQEHNWEVNNLPGTVQLNQALYLIDAEENRIPVESAINCGNYVTVFEFLLAGELSTQEKFFSIIPREINVDNITLIASSVIYDGYNHYPELKNVPELINATVTVYPFDGTVPITQVVNAGKYRVEVVLLPETSNYMPSNESLEFVFEIFPVEIDVSGLEFDSTTFTYDGKAHFPTLKNIPELIEATMMLYPSEETEPIVQAVNAGKYRIKVVLVSKNSNYVPSNETFEIIFEIFPIEIDVSGLEFDSTTFAYNGKQQYPSLKNVPAHVTASTYLHWDGNEYNNSEIWDGKWLAIDIGVYGCRITLRSENSNYKLVGPTIYTTSFEISRIPIDISDKFTEDFELIYTPEGYNNDILKELVLDGISEHVECILNSYRFEIGENQWQYTPTMISTGRYKIEIMFRVKDSTNYSLLYNGVQYQQIIIDVYFKVVE